ncbi:hypothetical protein HDC92_005032 [Pedobacter sp. AK017]|uniref:PD-(D/E)XK nuclease family transposase n=1 Tax=Pedobacter sp. AK017 TaxID=2723073 RepID=UPI0016125805|nr:PD-(D/E)XK nuclease family transposase [Pedobacter sp. AK017]MBB5441324.1 hypothetical protein [Pedobacter sp. AK017]
MQEQTSTAAHPKQKREPKPTTFIDAFVDFSFKRLFATEESKPILIGLLNHLFKGRKYITEIEYGKNEFPGEIAQEGGAVFDVYCTDVNGSKFIIEVQRGNQEYFKERALFYVSRAISEQAPKGDRKGWAYKLTEVYLLAFLEDFNLPDSPKSEYVQDICLANRHTGIIFYDKEFDQLFTLANYASLTPEERDMYNSSLKRKWDNKNVLDYAAKKGLEQGLQQGEHKKAVEVAKTLLTKNIDLNIISEATGLSQEEIQSLQK